MCSSVSLQHHSHSYLKRDQEIKIKTNFSCSPSLGDKPKLPNVAPLAGEAEVYQVPAKCLNYFQIVKMAKQL